MTKNIFFIFQDFLTRYPKHFGLLFLLLIIEGGFAALSVLALVPMAEFMIDPNLLNPSKVTNFILYVLLSLQIEPSFLIFATLFVGLNFIKGFFEIAVRYSILKIKYTVCLGLFNEALSSFFKARWEFFSNSDHGKLLNTLNRELNTIGDTLGHLATFLAHFIQLSIFLIIPIWLNHWLTLIAISLAILFSLPFLFLHKVSYKLGKLNNDTANNSLNILSEILDASRVIIGYGQQKKSKLHFINAFNKHTIVTLQAQILSTAIPKLFQPMVMLSIVLAVGLVINDQSHISELAAVMWSLLSAMPILTAMLQGNLALSNFLPSYQQLQELQENALKVEEVEGAHYFENLKKGIDLINVDFTYPGRAHTLSNINIHIKKGQMTAIVGESGSGKSTIIDLILGLQVPNKGKILIDGIPLFELNLNSFRSSIGYVPQDSQLFNLTIRENLLWAKEDATESELWDCLYQANALDFVKDLPLSIDTRVGNRGFQISGGQRQRIALARALIRKPSFLILDEATSSLDIQSEILIQEAIEKIIKTTSLLVIAHKFSTISKADQIYVVNKGIMVESGSFLNLKNEPNSYLQAMFRKQIII